MRDILIYESLMLSSRNWTGLMLHSRPGVIIMRKLFLFLLAGSLLVSQARSQIISGNYGFLEDTPFAGFNREDQQMFNNALNKALDAPLNGNTAEWRNDRTGSSGRIMVTADPDGKPNCRHAHIINVHKTTQGSADYQFCKNNGKWAGRLR
jgi:surface antigen